MVEYVEFKDKIYCKLHKVSFLKGSQCPTCVSSGTIKPLKEMQTTFTSDSQAITSDSQGVHDLKRKYVRKVKDSIFERFHAYGIRFEAIIRWEALFKYEPIKLRNNVEYKKIHFDKGFVKVFKKSIVVILRSKSEIVGLSVREAELISKRMVNDILDMLPDSIKVSNREVVSLHNAFVNHPNAKRGVSVTIEGEKRFISDNSKGYSEFEAINPKFAITDSEAIEQDIISLVDKGLSRDFIAKSIVDLVADRKFWAEHQRSHVQAIQDLSKGVNELRDVVRQNRVKDLKHEWGW